MSAKNTSDDLINRTDLPPSYGAQDQLRAPLIKKQEQVDFGANVEGGTACISFHNVVYGVQAGPICRPSEKTILNDISGIVPRGLSAIMGPTGSGKTRRNKRTILHGLSGLLPPGLSAIMGPTGSGKTSLLDVLAGRKDPSGLSGVVLVNGRPQPKNFKCVSGYVVQDDIVMGTLSVRENLHFSAALRLPSSTTRAQRRERVERVIAELGLQSCADTKMGTEFFRGVSGGERKRTNIGMELIIEPQVLFLDEPTTGLDANTAVSVIQLLKDLCRRHKSIIIMSIHQPRYSIFKLVDRLTLLSQGNMVYHGDATQALQYFNELGFPCEEHDNPADFFLDVIIACEKNLTGKDSTSNGNVKAIEDLEKNEEHSVDLAATYQRSQIREENQKSLDSILSYSSSTSVETVVYPSYATNFLWQFLVVSYRSMINLIRNPMVSVFQVITMMIFALLVGVLYLQLNRKEFNRQTVATDRVGAIFFIVLNTVFGNLSAVEVFIKQKAIFIHENISGYYRVSAFFFAKVVMDILPVRLVPLLFFTVIAYFMIGFQVAADNFFIFLLTIFLVSVVSTSLAFAISARVPVTGVANLLIAMTYVLSMLFGGFLVSLSSLPVWLRWLKYLSLFRYSVEALVINEISGQCYFDSKAVLNQTWTNFSCLDYNATIGTECELPNCINGTDTLDLLGYETAHEWIWYDQIGLVGLMLVFLSLTYFNLRTIKKLK